MSDGIQLLLTSLLERVQRRPDGLYWLRGPISPIEYAALATLIKPNTQIHKATAPTILPGFNPDLSLLSDTSLDRGMLCIDFGTAASKVGYDPGNDTFEPLAIGTRAGEGAPFWTVSAVAIDGSGKMSFGGRAIEAKKVGFDTLTAFKSLLWKDPKVISEVALSHGDVTFTVRDCIVAYLGYLTQLAREELESKGIGGRVPRRYAMPFAYDEERRGVREALADMLGWAALLSDSLGAQLVKGVDCRLLRTALDSILSRAAPDWLVKGPGCVGEPVAAGNFAMDEEIGKLTVYMIVDIGAGTTDFCILCLKKRADGDFEPIQISNGSLSIEVAGNAVDDALTNFLARVQAGPENREELAAIASTLKERLFALQGADERFDIDLSNGATIEVNRTEFIESLEWQNVVELLKEAQAKCFDQAERGYVQQYGSGPVRVVITGGGSALPLREQLAEGRSSGDVELIRTFADDYPPRVQQRFANIINDLPRLAVALGGCRPSLPGELDRTKSVLNGAAPVRVWKPFDKAEVGLPSE